MGIYVGNLSYDATEQDPNNIFSEHGTIRRVILPTDRDTGRARGFAFIKIHRVIEDSSAFYYPAPPFTERSIAHRKLIQLDAHVNQSEGNLSETDDHESNEQKNQSKEELIILEDGVENGLSAEEIKQLEKLESEIDALNTQVGEKLAVLKHMEVQSRRELANLAKAVSGT